MKNYQRSIFIIVGLLAVVALLYFVFQKDREKYNWGEYYSKDGKDPYDTYVISEMLKSYFPDETFKSIGKGDEFSETLPIDAEEAINYVFIGDHLHLDSTEKEALVSFVENGNNAFIASNTLPGDFIPRLYADECESLKDYYYDHESGEYIFDDYEYYGWSGYEIYNNEKVELQFSHPDLKTEEPFNYVHQYKDKERDYYWRYIDDWTFCEQGFDYEILGRLGLDSLNFIRLKHGDGTFYFHTNPLVFSNYQMIREEALAYAGRVFSHLPEGDIYWDENSKFADYSEFTPPPRNFSQSPLQYILSQKSLRWSWYTGLVLVILYVLFRAKRRQRIIPVLKENANTSLEYIKTIGSLYFQQNAHKKLAQQEMKLFLYFLRDRYNIPTQQLDETFIKKVAIKSEVPAEEIQKILKTWKKVQRSSSIAPNTLVYFHGLVDDFYRNSK
ncbi:MAG: hypothetical protein AAF502_20700 [Bacteroidota bacterium]